MPLDHDNLRILLTYVQDGVVSRRQLLELGAHDHDIKRMVRHKDLVRVPHQRGVFVNHTGRITWAQRAWAAVLVHWPAALARESALPGARGTGGPIHVAIAPGRKVARVPRVVTHRTPDYANRVDTRRAPPRVRLEHACIDVASAWRDDVPAVYRMLTDACHTRETSPVKIADVLATRRVPGRALIGDLLDDLATGACSVLERGYLKLVEQAHGLPSGRRQRPGRAGGQTTARDVQYDAYDLIVELDGRAYHEGALARDADALRDLDARVDEDVTTVRLTYGLVFGTPCRTARAIETLLRRGGWPGRTTRCPECPD